MMLGGVIIRPLFLIATFLFLLFCVRACVAQGNLAHGSMCFPLTDVLPGVSV